MTSEPPSLPSSWLTEGTRKWIEVRTAFAGSDFKDVSALATKLTAKADPVSAFLASKLSDSTLQTLTRFQEGGASVTAARVALMQDLNSLILKTNIYAPDRFSGCYLAGPNQATARARRPAAQHAPAQPVAARRRLSTGTGLPGRRFRREQPVRRHAGVGRLLLLPSGPGQRRGPVA